MTHSGTAVRTALLLLITLLSWTASATTLQITATHLESDAGSIVVWVYDNADDWLSDRWRTRKTVPVADHLVDGSVTLELDLPPGVYAFTVFHDLDDDTKLERNFMGLPKEPSGLSNNLRPRFGPPRFKNAAFSLEDEPVEQRIRLH